MKTPELFIFDMDGLLFNTEYITMMMKGIVLKEYGYESTREDYVKSLGLGGDALMKQLHDTYGPDYPAAEINEKIKVLETQYIHEHGPEIIKPGVEKLLAWSKNNNIKCVIASSTKSEFVRDYVECAGLSGFFDMIIGGESVTRSKPDPDIFLLACDRAGISPANAVVFEDSENGVRAAYNAGIPVICIPDMKYPCEEAANKASFIIGSADEAISLFEN